jgi:hypothetical protein
MRRRIAVALLAALVPASTAAAVRPGPFAGQWWGHTRSLHLDAAGRGREFDDDGCCRRVLDFDFRLLSVSRTGTTEQARIRVTTIRVDRVRPRIRVGQIETLRLRRGVIVDSLSGASFCAPNVGRCGA